jgi:ADP-heptose:LPS heptosyltransferase
VVNLLLRMGVDLFEIFLKRKKLPYLVIRYGGLGDLIMTLNLVMALADEKRVILLTCCHYREFLAYLDLKNVDYIFVRKSIHSLLSFKELLFSFFSTLNKIAFRRFDKIFLPYQDLRYRKLCCLSFYSSLIDLHGAKEDSEPYFGKKVLQMSPWLQHKEMQIPVAQKRSTKEVLFCLEGNLKTEKGKFLRMWPIEHYVELARELILEKIEVIVVLQSKNVEIEKAFLGINMKFFISSSLVEVTKKFQETGCIVTGDSGLFHLAQLLQVPTVAIFGSTDWKQRVDDKASKVKIIADGYQLSCAPCYDGKNYRDCPYPHCMALSSSKKVLKEVLSICQLP